MVATKKGLSSTLIVGRLSLDTFSYRFNNDGGVRAGETVKEIRDWHISHWEQKSFLGQLGKGMDVTYPPWEYAGRDRNKSLIHHWQLGNSASKFPPFERGLKDAR